VAAIFLLFPHAPLRSMALFSLVGRRIKPLVCLIGGFPGYIPRFVRYLFVPTIRFFTPPPPFGPVQA